jgi:IclR family mhp operon transcriptional activator
MTKAVQSVARCLQVLEYVNLHCGATVRQISQATGLTRGTVFRLLETLRQEGYLRKDLGSTMYWPTGRLRALSDGYQEEWWIDAFAKQIINDLGERTKWPVKLLTLSGYEMLTRVTTDFQSPLTDGKIPTGYRVSLLWTAAGRVFLAFSSENTRAALLKGCESMPATQQRNQPRRGIPDRDELDAMLRRIRRQGHEIVDQPLTAYYSLALPVLVGDQAIASLAAFFFRMSIKQSQALKIYKPMLETAAAAIGERFQQVAFEPGFARARR